MIPERQPSVLTSYLAATSALVVSIFSMSALDVAVESCKPSSMKKFFACILVCAYAEEGWRLRSPEARDIVYPETVVTVTCR